MLQNPLRFRLALQFSISERNGAPARDLHKSGSGHRTPCLLRRWWVWADLQRRWSACGSHQGPGTEGKARTWRIACAPALLSGIWSQRPLLSEIDIVINELQYANWVLVICSLLLTFSSCVGREIELVLWNYSCCHMENYCDTD